MTEIEKLEWSALEYEEKIRSNDWFWALGIIVVAGSITSIIFANYFFAALLIISGILLWVFAVKKPETVHYELNSKGLKIKTRLYPYEKMKAFYVRTEGNPHLFVRTERFFMPVIYMPIEIGMANTIKNVLLSKKVLEEKMEEHPYERAMESVGF